MADTRKPNLPEGVTMSELTNLRSEAIHGKRRNQRTVLKTYQLSDADGAPIGKVFQRLMTFEQKTPGNRFVNSRWHSPRWSWELVGRIGAHRVGYETRQEAIAALFNKREQLAVDHAATV